MNVFMARKILGDAVQRLPFRGKGKRAGAALVAATVMLLFAAPSAVADYAVDRFVGEGMFDIPSGVAVNQSTGQVFMVDRGNHRVLRLGAHGDLEAVWGRGVRTGGTGAEICMAPASCQAGTRGQAEGMFVNPAHVTVSQSSGHVYVYDGTNRRVQEFSFDENGTPGDPSDDLPVFVRTWGWGVDDGSEEFQICEAGCRAGLSGKGAGQFASGGRPSGNGIAVSPMDGDVFVADPDAARILRFKSDGTLASEWEIGGAGRFANILAITVDSQGILYAADTQGAGEIERYDSAGVHGAAGFLDPISVPPVLSASSTDPLHQFQSSGGLAIDRTINDGNEIDQLLLYRLPSDGTGLGSAVVQRFDEPGNVDPPTSDSGPLVEGVFGNHGSRGIGVNPSANTLYVTSATPGGDAGPGLYILDDDGTPASVDATVPTEAAVGPHDATFEGQINPTGGRARYWFEYARADDDDWTRLEMGTVSGSGLQTVSAEVENLEANTDYKVRLQARKVLGPDAGTWASATSPESVVHTVAIPPTVATQPVHSFTDDGAWMAAQVNPEGSETTYYFEYGEDTEYGNVTPVRDAGQAGTPSRVLEPVSGLESDTTYHYRIVAVNPKGKSEGPDRTFRTRPISGFAERAYEQVSPMDKLGIDITSTLRGGGSGPSDAHPVSKDGNAAAFLAWQALPGQEWGGNPDPGDYVARRSASGWETKAMRPRPFDSFHVNYKARLMSWPNLERALLWSISPLEDPPVEGVLHVHDAISDEVKTIEVSGTSVSLSLGSDDLGNIAFAHKDLLVPDPGLPGTGTLKAYEYVVATGEVRLVSRQPGSNLPFAGEARIAGEQSPSKILSAVSSNGEHIFFEAVGTTGARDIYRRSGGSTSILISGSQRSPVDPMGVRDKRFLGATRDGSTVFFTSAEQLTDDANTGQDREGNELYRYNVDSGQLLALSAETNTSDGARVQGILGFADDGNVVYYVALGQVIPGAGVEGKPNVYRWSDDGTLKGDTRFIATLSESASCSPEFGLQDSCAYTGMEYVRTARVSSDGQVALFQSTRSLTGYPTDGYPQIYIYEADAHDGAGGLSCVSCRVSGQPSGGASTLPRSVPPAGGRLSPVLSDDGTRVFFNSEDRLVPSDVNDHSDVYEWEAGRVRLISTGESVSDATFSGADPSGDNVFFVTRSRLVGQDVDDLLDVYVARVGGGLKGQWPTDPGERCVGEGCKPPPPPPPGLIAPTTPSIEGPGNVKVGRDCRPLKRRAVLQDRNYRRVQRKASRVLARMRMERVRARGARGRSDANRLLRRRAKGLRRGASILRKRSKRARARARACRRQVSKGMSK